MFRDKVSAKDFAELTDKFREYSGRSRVIDPNTPVNVNRDVFEFVGMASKELYGSASVEPDYAGIARHYGLEFKGGGERIAVMTNPIPANAAHLVKTASIDLAGVTSIDIAAAKKGKILGPDGKPAPKPFDDLAVIGGVFTGDDKLLVGTRSRRYGKELTADRVMNLADNCYALAPGGGATFSYSGNPLEFAMEHEAAEELALRRSEMKSMNLVGLFHAIKVGPTGLKFVYDIATPIESGELLERHRRGLARYNELHKNGMSQQEVAATLQSEGLAPDVWEHSRLEALSLEETISRLRAIEPNMQNPLENRVCGIGVGAILALLQTGQ